MLVFRTRVKESEKNIPRYLVVKDMKIGEKLAYVLTGGDKAGLTKTVDEQYILDIERETFVSLAGEKLTQDRIKYMLKKGKPLRN